MHCLIVRSHCALKRASKLHTHLCALLEFKILATVAVYVCFDSAENSSNMNIRFFVEYKKKNHSVSGSVSSPDGTIFKCESKVTCCN